MANNKTSQYLNSNNIVNSNINTNLPEFDGNLQNNNNFTRPDGKFDNAAFIKQFNKIYEEQHNKNVAIAKAKDAAQLALLNKEFTNEQPYKKNIYQILVGIKNTWFEIIDDMLLLNYDRFLIKKNRLFYIGLTILIIVLCVYIFDFLLLLSLGLLFCMDSCVIYNILYIFIFLNSFY